MDYSNDLDAARKSLGPVGTYLPVPFTSAPAVCASSAGQVRPGSILICGGR